MINPQPGKQFVKKLPPDRINLMEKATDSTLFPTNGVRVSRFASIIWELYQHQDRIHESFVILPNTNCKTKIRTLFFNFENQDSTKVKLHTGLLWALSAFV